MCPADGAANNSQQRRAQLGFTLLAFATLLMECEPKQYEHLENEPWGKVRLPLWLKGYIEPRYKPLAR